MASEREKTSIPKVVEIMVQFLRIGVIDTLNEKYHAEVKIISKWKPLENFNRYDRNRYWNPELFIENALEEPKESIRYALVNEGNERYVVEKRRIKG
ncbi:Gamma-aminobutyric acid receptor subunit gamma-3 [Brachionus plicatilis]|uniref:Gamma-aminobutyric acid receptor subunit gamma-3 n=1 Tax=Brachionus plicatilis TaxID=10195 RepID=A0A3M7QFD8_BRAPC|nr:Gamma-aminobutyric acid receptor subunit gamma-3 [Brachionus plicatilis]